MNGSQLAFVLFGAGAAGGLLMILLTAARIKFPRFLGMAHGLTGLLGLAVLFATNLRGEDATPPAAWWAFGVLTLALVGGLLLFRALFPTRIPLPLAFAHAGVAAAGLWLLNPLAFAL